MISTKLREALTMKGWSAYKAGQVAKERGISITRDCIEKHLRDQHEPTMPTLRALSQLLDVPITYWIEEES